MSSAPSPFSDYLVGEDVRVAGRGKWQIYREAEQLSLQWRAWQRPRLADLVQEIGGRIRYAPLDLDHCSGSIAVHGPGNFEISLPEDISPARERFTIAHELGHYVLHSRQGASKIIAQRNPPGVIGQRLEWEANWFAGGFLMPSRPFREKLAIGTLVAVAVAFGVSLAAAKIRADQLSNV